MFRYTEIITLLNPYNPLEERWVGRTDLAFPRLQALRGNVTGTTKDHNKEREAVRLFKPRVLVLLPGPANARSRQIYGWCEFLDRNRPQQSSTTSPDETSIERIVLSGLGLSDVKEFCLIFRHFELNIGITVILPPSTSYTRSTFQTGDIQYRHQGLPFNYPHLTPVHADKCPFPPHATFERFWMTEAPRQSLPAPGPPYTPHLGDSVSYANLPAVRLYTFSSYMAIPEGMLSITLEEADAWYNDEEQVTGSSEED